MSAWRASCGERSDKSTVRGRRSPTPLLELWEVMALTAVYWTSHGCRPSKLSTLARRPRTSENTTASQKVAEHPHLFQWLNTPRTRLVSKPRFLWHCRPSLRAISCSGRENAGIPADVSSVQRNLAQSEIREPNCTAKSKAAAQLKPPCDTVSVVSL